MPWFSSRSSYSQRSRAPSTYSRSSSYYKRRPRDGYIERMIHKIRKLIRDIYDYARRHPAKIFFLVILPLISGGVLAKFAKQFGIALPTFLQGSAGVRGGSAYGSGYYGSAGYGDGIGATGLGGVLGGAGTVGSLIGIAKNFV